MTTPISATRRSRSRSARAISRDVAVDADGAVFGPDDEERPGSDNSTREIVWNADVRMLKDSRSYMELEIDGAGYISRSNGITVNGGYGTIGTYVGGGVINVDNIVARESYNRAVFRAYNNYDAAGNVLGNLGTVSGNQGKWTLEKGAGVISIRNYSSASIRINNIDALGKTTEPGNGSRRSASISGLTTASCLRRGRQLGGVQFRHLHHLRYDRLCLLRRAERADHQQHLLEFEVLLAGLIDNPLGRTYISSIYGGILADNPNAIVRSAYLSLSTSYYGTAPVGISGGGGEFRYYEPIRIELIDGANQPARADGHGRWPDRARRHDPAAHRRRDGIDRYGRLHEPHRHDRRLFPQGAE